MKFIVDGMLGSLARKLRLYGMDVFYSSNADDSDLLNGALSDGRIILTSDKRLHEQALRIGTQSILLTENTDRDRLVTVFRGVGVKPSAISASSSRCPSCNGTLNRVNRVKIQEHVPRSVAHTHAVFYLCSSCGKIFWEGSHWRRISAMSKYVMNRLAEESPNEDLDRPRG